MDSLISEEKLEQVRRDFLSCRPAQTSGNYSTEGHLAFKVTESMVAATNAVSPSLAPEVVKTMLEAALSGQVLDDALKFYADPATYTSPA